jgi:CDP-6-deoxy-D-xylo-4-hexulose-3-dehydrase
MEIPLALNGLDESELEIVFSVFRSGNVTMGEQVQIFEEKFAKKMRVKHAIMVNSGSSANLLGLEILASKLPDINVSQRGEFYVAVPAILWPTSIWPIVQLGFRALLIDTVENSLEIDLDKLLEAKNEFGHALIGAVLIHPLGKSLDLAKISKLRDDTGMFFVEDNCESLGSGSLGKFAGTIGEVGTFSFYYSHHITTVEGGMIVTESDEIANLIRSMRAHGWTRNRQDKAEIENAYPEFNKDFLFVTPGYNFRPMEFQGALGISQLDKLDSFLERRLQIISKVAIALAGSNFEILGLTNEQHFSAVQIDLSKGPVPHSWMAIPISYKGTNLTLEQVHSALNYLGVATRPVLAGNFVNQPAGKHEMISIFRNLENSNEIYAKSFMIGNHHNISDQQLAHLLDALMSIIRLDEP